MAFFFAARPQGVCVSYQIDIEGERLISLAEAARSLPGGAVHVATVHRWRLRGIRGIRLPSVLVGGIRYTSREALVWWFAAVTAVADGTVPTSRTSSQRERAIAAAERELADAGI